MVERRHAAGRAGAREPPHPRRALAGPARRREADRRSARRVTRRSSGQAGQAALAGEEGQATELVADALENAQLGIQQIREVARGIHPSTLCSGGLDPTLKAIAGRSPIPVRLDLPTGSRLHGHVDVTGYYVASEALTNAVTYSGASSVRLTAEAVGGVLWPSVEDDIVGEAGRRAGPAWSGSGSASRRW